MPAAVGSVNGPSAGPSTRSKGKKEPVEAQKRTGRPNTMGDQLGDAHQWACAAAGTAVPQGLTRAERAWAALTGVAIFWLSKLADEF
eukprot:2738578-Pyramimonas_sp.AAC.1